MVQTDNRNNLCAYFYMFQGKHLKYDIVERHDSYSQDGVLILFLLFFCKLVFYTLLLLIEVTVIGLNSHYFLKS